MKAYNKYAVNKEQILEDLKYSLEEAFDTSKLQEQIDTVTMELEAVSLLVRKLIDENSSMTMSQIEYKKKYEALEQNFNEKHLKLEARNSEKAEIESRKTELVIFIEKFENSPEVITEWDQTLWNLFVVKAVVKQDGKVVIEFKSWISTKNGWYLAIFSHFWTDTKNLYLM